jgi:hypothetical protein
MSERFVNPTYYVLQKAILRSEFSPDTVRGIDITLLIPSLTLVSSIESDTMYGTIQIIDSVGLLEELPLRGEEQIIMEIADSKMINANSGEKGEVSDPYRFVGFIYKIDNVETTEINDTVTYDLHFISYQSFKAGTYEIIRSFKDKKVSDIVKLLFDQFYKSSDVIRSFLPERRNLIKDLIIPEETDGDIRCWIPKMRPEEAMEFLTKRSYSTTSPSCTFRFFENSRGYHYVTDEQIFRLALEDEKRRHEFTYLDAIPNRLEYFDQQIKNLETIQNETRVNSLDDIYSGAYRNVVIELDILSRQLNLLDTTRNRYDYFERRNRYFDVQRFQQVKGDRHTNKFINSVHRGDQDVEKTWLIIQNYTRGESSGDNAMQAETYYSEIVSNRQAYPKHVESITLNARGPGRLDVTAGDVIDLRVSKFKAAVDKSDGAFEEDKRLSGSYIVKSVVHRMNKEEMYNEYVMYKRNWSQIDFNKEEIDRTNAGLGAGTAF